MDTVRVSITVKVEYDLHPENYPVGSTIDEMIAIDVEAAEQDPYLFMDLEGSTFVVTGGAV
jgi:hypothetical protein